MHNKRNAAKSAQRAKFVHLAVMDCLDFMTQAAWYSAIWQELPRSS
jgi:hypothetical protein